MPACETLLEEECLPAEAASPSALAEHDGVSRITHRLHELERLAELLAVEDGYEPAEREFSLPQGFKLSIVIPVYNEEATIERVLAEVLALPIPKEVIVVDDASTDRTRDILRQYEPAQGLHVIHKPQNEGKGAALRTGLRCATGEVVVIQDADLEYDPRDILELVHPLIAGQADVVYGSRFLTGRRPQTSWLHRLGNGFLTRLSNWTTGLDLTDMETCYKAFRRDVLASFEIKQPRFGFEPEVTARIARRGYRVYEVPVRYRPRSYAEGKKIGLRDLFSTLYCIVRYAVAD
jgi:glycosyltransferase involved in cell wall biosynthesis